MRRAVLLLGPIVAAWTLFACENDSSSGGATAFTVEAGTFDAPGLSDSVAPDVQAPKAGVTVSVTRAGLPAAGITVVFNDAAGAVLQVVVTGADGAATSTGAVPATASALLGGSAAVTSRRVLTWVDVKVGDVLSTVDLFDTAVVARYDVSFGSFAEATSYRAASGKCSGTGDSPIAIPLSRACTNATNSVLGVAVDVGGNPLAVAFKKGNATPSTDGGAGAVTLGPWLMPSDLAVTVTNPPAGSIDALVGQFSEGATYLSDTRSFVGTGTTVQFAPGFAEALEPAVVALNATGGGTRALVKRIAPGPVVAFDFATVLPAILTGTVDTTNVKRPVVAWTTVAPLSGSDGGNVTLTWVDQGHEGGWTFIVPPTATSVKAPELPAEAAAWLPVASAVAGSSGQIIFADVDFVSSYDAFRKGAGQAMVGPDLFAGALLPQNGTLRTTTFALPLD